MQNPESFYQEHFKYNEDKVKELFKKMSLLSVLRLIVFVLTSFGIYMTFGKWKIAVGIAVFGIIIFLFL